MSSLPSIQIIANEGIHCYRFFHFFYPASIIGWVYAYKFSFINSNLTNLSSSTIILCLQQSKLNRISSYIDATTQQYFIVGNVAWIQKRKTRALSKKNNDRTCHFLPPLIPFCKQSLYTYLVASI